MPSLINYPIPFKELTNPVARVVLRDDSENVFKVENVSAITFVGISNFTFLHIVCKECEHYFDAHNVAYFAVGNGPNPKQEQQKTTQNTCQGEKPVEGSFRYPDGKNVHFVVFGI